MILNLEFIENERQIELKLIETEQVFETELIENKQTFETKLVENEQTLPLEFAENEQTIEAKFEAIQTVTEFVGGEVYTGAYEVKPLVVQQTLETKYKVMKDDVTILEIPYMEVTNSTGGTTVIIG